MKLDFFKPIFKSTPAIVKEEDKAPVQVITKEEDKEPVQLTAAETPTPAPVCEDATTSKKMIPAVTFRYNRVAAGNTLTENGEVYEAFLNIIDKCNETNIDALTGNWIDPPFAASNLRYNVMTTSEIMVSSLSAACSSHYFNFVTNFNKIIDSISANCDTDMKLLINQTGKLYYYTSPFEFGTELQDKINQVIDIDGIDLDAIIESNAFDSACFAIANNMGLDVYNTAYGNLIRVMAILGEPENEDPKSVIDLTIALFNKTFTSLMANVSYEVAVFCYNFNNFNKMFFSPELLNQLEHVTPINSSYSCFDPAIDIDYEDPRAILSRIKHSKY